LTHSNGFRQKKVTAEIPASMLKAKNPQAPSRFRIPWLPGEHPKVGKNNTFEFAATSGDGVMKLADVIGKRAASEIEATHRLSFHAVGDTGKGAHSAQQDVAEAMTRDINQNNHAKSPAFLFHLGDVIYGDGKENLYDDEFYRPYAEYPNKIIAIPGNHDGDVGVTVDKESLKAFRDNFCAPAGSEPPLAKTFSNEMVHQPGVYWMLETKLLNLIGMYSNAAEDAGTLGDANVGMHQLDWLGERLKQIAADRKSGPRKALIVGMHHPPFARGLSDKGYGHGSSDQMRKQLDDAFDAAGVWPDLVLSGHAHNYQHYVRGRNVNGAEKHIPYIIAGTGGFAIQPAPSGVGTTKDDTTYKNGSPPKGLFQPTTGYGYLTITVRPKQIQADFIIVQGNHRQPFETTTIPLT
jgi:hypothetical protein